MIVTLNPDFREVHVVGAGMAGLLIAYRLDQLGYEVHLYEKDRHTGGLITTTQSEFGMAEAAAHSLLVSDEVQKLFSQLDIELFAVNADSKARFIMRDGKPRKFPLKIREALIAFFRAYFVLSRGHAMSLQAWGERFIGRQATRYLLQSFVRGIYGAQLEELDTHTAFPALEVPRGHSLLSFMLKKRLARKEKRVRPKMMAPRDGMQSVTRVLTERLHARLGERFKLDCEIKTVTQFENKNLILTLPAQAAFKLLEATEPELAGDLEKIAYATLVSVTIFIEKNFFARVPQGVGVLIPKEENRRALGILYNSSSFAGRVNDPSMVSLTMMLGGSLDAEVVNLSDAEIIKIVNSELKIILGAQSPARHLVIHRWPKAVPKYNWQLAHVWKSARAGFCAKPGRILFSNYSGQVSLRGMIESIAKLTTRVATDID